MEKIVKLKKQLIKSEKSLTKPKKNEDSSKEFDEKLTKKVKDKQKEERKEREHIISFVNQNVILNDNVFKNTVKKRSPNNKGNTNQIVFNNNAKNQEGVLAEQGLFISDNSNQSNKGLLQDSKQNDVEFIQVIKQGIYKNNKIAQSKNKIQNEEILKSNRGESKKISLIENLKNKDEESITNMKFEDISSVIKESPLIAKNEVNDSGFNTKNNRIEAKSQNIRNEQTSFNTNNLKSTSIINQMAKSIETSNIGRQNSITINLKPEYLGDMEVSIHNTDNGFLASIHVQKEEVRELIRSNVGEISTLLSQKIGKVDSITVESMNRDNSFDFNPGTEQGNENFFNMNSNGTGYSREHMKEGIVTPENIESETVESNNKRVIRQQEPDGRWSVYV